MQKSEAIQGVIDLLAEPGSWTKYAMARPMKDGGALGVIGYTGRFAACNEAADEAQSWCLSGALSRVVGMAHSDYNDSAYQDYMPAWSLFDRLVKERGARTAVEFNNAAETTHEDLMLMLKEALVEAEIEEAQAAIDANLRDCG